MLEGILVTFLISASPLGEGRVGIPLGLFNYDLDPFVVFFASATGNALVFPIMIFFIEHINKYLMKVRLYKRISIRTALRVRRQTSHLIEKYGFWGLMFFVMIPLPVTGAYMGTLAAYIFNINRRHAYWAVSIGITISCAIVTIAMQLGIVGYQKL